MKMSQLQQHLLQSMRVAQHMATQQQQQLLLCRSLKQ
jgi:hypothetical protein